MIVDLFLDQIQNIS